jgi:tetratricopeptide (TPR) repeat protein
MVALAAVLGCNDNEETSPFDEILTAAPYAPLTDSIRKEPQRDELYFRRAVLLNTNNYPEPALADFRHAWSLQKQERYAFGISTILVEKKPDSAITFLAEALKELPESILLKLSLARAYDLQNKPDDALRVTDDILRANPEQVDVLKMKAELLDKKGNRDDAINTLEKAYRLTPFDIELNYVLALKYAESKNPKVLVLCDSLAKADSLNIHAEPYYYKGIYYSNINDKTKAIALFNEAITRDYNFLDAHIEKGIIVYEQKKYADAYAIFNKAMSISPKYADAYYWMAKAQQAMGQKDEARLNYQRAYGLDKTLVQAKDSANKL